MRRLIPLLLLLAGPTAAQDADDDYDPAVLQGCLEAGWFRDDPASCIGVGAARCLQGEAGQSTMGLGHCFSSEWAQWDQLLNDTYAELVDMQIAMDKDTAAYNDALAVAEDSLRTMQRAWIVFRDAACEFEYAQWTGGSGAGPASAQCMLELTAAQALRLQEYLE